MKLYNSLSQNVEKFVPLRKKTVTLFVCGITPYDTTHLGHAFTYMSFDALSRYLAYKGYRVHYTQNVTDIDDDILKKAKEKKQDWRKLGAFWTDRFLKDLTMLNMQIPTHYVRATDSIEKIIAMNKSLLKKKNAYEKNGNVYFSIESFDTYGQLSRYSKKEMVEISQERGNNVKDPLKKDPLDFVLWQKSLKGEPSWKSPWGEGRPGWHIECSAMIHQYLGKQIDIHGGGADLIYPHHDSEIAQSESYTGKAPFVQYWMHTAMVMYEKEKMSKSLGNLVMVSDLLKKYDANVIRWYLLSYHYRDVWEFDEKKLQLVETRWKALVKKISLAAPSKNDLTTIRKFERFVENDLDTPSALQYLFSMASDITKKTYNEKKNQQITSIINCLQILGFVL